MEAEKANFTRQGLSLLVEWFESQHGDLGKVKFYEMLAEKLSRVVGQEPAWTWRYVQGVHKGSIDPGAKLHAAVMALGAMLDDVPVQVAYTMQVQVLARPGAIQPGSLVLSESRPCQWPGCRVSFVPRVPWQKYCSQELHLAAEREKRQKRSGKNGA